MATTQRGETRAKLAAAFEQSPTAIVAAVNSDSPDALAFRNAFRGRLQTLAAAVHVSPPTRSRQLRPRPTTPPANNTSPKTPNPRPKKKKKSKKQLQQLDADREDADLDPPANNDNNGADTPAHSLRSPSAPAGTADTTNDDPVNALGGSNPSPGAAAGPAETSQDDSVNVPGTSNGTRENDQTAAGKETEKPVRKPKKPKPTPEEVALKRIEELQAHQRIPRTVNAYIQLVQDDFGMTAAGDKASKEDAGLRRNIDGFDKMRQQTRKGIRQEWARVVASSLSTMNTLDGCLMGREPIDYPENATDDQMAKWFVENCTLRQAQDATARGTNLAFHMLNTMQSIEFSFTWNKQSSELRSLALLRLFRTESKDVDTLVDEDDETVLNHIKALPELLEKYTKWKQKKHNAVSATNRLYRLYVDYGPQVIVDRQWTQDSLIIPTPKFAHVYREFLAHAGEQVDEGGIPILEAQFDANRAATLGIADALDPALGSYAAKFFERVPCQPYEAAQERSQMGRIDISAEG